MDHFRTGRGSPVEVDLQLGLAAGEGDETLPVGGKLAKEARGLLNVNLRGKHY